MIHSISYLHSAKDILVAYKGEEPFSSFLKKYFAQHKKYGSRDRKQISHLCYCYFRLGKATSPNPLQRRGLYQQSLQIEERILIGLFLCSNESNVILQDLKPEWSLTPDPSPHGEGRNARFQMKLSSLNYHLTSQDIFPWADELSADIDKEQFIFSHFQQPDLFLRLRPGKEKMVKQKLQQAGIDFRIISDSCLALNNASKVDSIIELDKEAVVQDWSSQQTGKLLQQATPSDQIIRAGSNKQPTYRAGRPATIKAWDCCAGSGGKSIMLFDLNPKIELTVSDVRESILINLKKRFSNAGIKNYHSFVVNLTSSLPAGQAGQQQETSNYDLIIADVPCTGSGTWSRTPEQLYYFNKEKINEYASLQRKIVSNVIPYLKPGGFLLFITCSVFKKENEEVVDFIQKEFNLQSQEMQVLKGYNKKADTMFVALLKRNL